MKAHINMGMLLEKSVMSNWLFPTKIADVEIIENLLFFWMMLNYVWIKFY